jgi:hypothetical protein
MQLVKRQAVAKREKLCKKRIDEDHENQCVIATPFANFWRSTGRADDPASTERLRRLDEDKDVRSLHTLSPNFGDDLDQIAAGSALLTPDASSNCRVRAEARYSFVRFHMGDLLESGGFIATGNFACSQFPAMPLRSVWVRSKDRIRPRASTHFS